MTTAITITITFFFECLTCDMFIKLNALHVPSLLILRPTSSPCFLEEEMDAYRAGKWQRENQCLSGIKVHALNPSATL